MAFKGGIKTTVGKTSRTFTFRKHTSEQHAHFLCSVAAFSTPITFNADNDNPHVSFDQLYDTLHQLLDTFYPVHSVTITSADPPYVTPRVKYMLRRKNHLMRSGQVEKAAALADKIGIAIKNHNSAELSRVDVLADPRSMWTKVRQLTGRSKATDVDASTPA